jgi:hypothetical protein
MDLDIIDCSLNSRNLNLLEINKLNDQNVLQFLINNKPSSKLFDKKGNKYLDCQFCFAMPNTQNHIINSCSLTYTARLDLITQFNSLNVNYALKSPWFQDLSIKDLILSFFINDGIYQKMKANLLFMDFIKQFLSSIFNLHNLNTLYSRDLPYREMYK